MKTKKAIVLFLMPALVQISIARGQGIDSIAGKAAMYFHEAEKASAGQTIWPQKLYGPMLFVDAGTRQAWANMPDNEGVLEANGEVYVGALPKSIIIANTAIDWGGRKWSVILWPLPDDREDRLNLVLHESFHRIQDALNLPAHSPTAGHLSTREGRIYFLLELQALKSALNKPADKRSEDLTSALLFRKKRELLFPETFKNEQVLEANEGMAEFTGVILGRDKQNIVKHLETVIDSAAKKTSLIRSATYITGPVYGYLLYNINKHWTAGVDSNSNFTDLVGKYYHVKISDKNVDAETEKRSALYNGAAITESENLKDPEHQKLEAQYVDLFTVKPVLVITLKNMQVGFNPSNLFDLGKYGTVYPTMTIKDKWGELQVSAGTGALMKDWQIVYLSVIKQQPAPSSSGIIKGDGWQLSLANGWKVKPDGANYKLVNE